MSQRLVMNYRHSSLGQWFTPSPCQEGRRIAGSLGLEEAVLWFPVPAAGSPQHGRQQRQKERGRRQLKDPKYLPALGHRPPFPGAAASALSVGRSQAPREAQDTQMPKDTCRRYLQCNPILACFWYGVWNRDTRSQHHCCTQPLSEHRVRKFVRNRVY